MRRNSALYVSSRTLFLLARNSEFEKIRNTIGRTNRGHTPLAAIFVSFVPGSLAFLIIKSPTTSFQEVETQMASLTPFALTTEIAYCPIRSPIRRSHTLYLCQSMYRFHPFSTRVGNKPADEIVTDNGRMKLFPNTIRRDSDEYCRVHYRAHWQPFWAILGLVLCTLLVVTQGWTAIYDLCAKSEGVSKEDSIVDLIAAYIGVSYPHFCYRVCCITSSG